MNSNDWFSHMSNNWNISVSEDATGYFTCEMRPIIKERFYLASVL